MRVSSNFEKITLWNSEVKGRRYLKGYFVVGCFIFVIYFGMYTSKMLAKTP